MPVYKVPLSEELENELLALLDRTGPDGYMIKRAVGIVLGKLRVDVRSNEHPPPHFHVSYNEYDASFCIETGRMLNGDKEMRKYAKHVETWRMKNQTAIIEAWNSSRPTDCPVGPIKLNESKS